MNQEEIKRIVLARIASVDEWADNGELRLRLIDEAFQKGWIRFERGTKCTNTN